MLVLFDVDGTLTATGTIDAEVFARTFSEAFGAHLPSTRWADYGCPTDQGITEEALRRLGLDPGRARELRPRFVEALRAELARRAAEPIRGAPDLLGGLVSAGHAVAIATGAWEDAARVKLAAAGVGCEGIPLVGSDIHPAREAILLEAMRRAPPSRRTVYVGDGEWDVRAARRLGLPFVGVDAEGTGLLRREGVGCVVSDFRDRDAFLRSLAECLVP